MPPASKVELCAAIRWDARAGMSGRAMERKHGVGRRADLDAPRKQRQTVTRVFHRLLIDKRGSAGVSYPVVRAYVAERRPQVRAKLAVAGPRCTCRSRTGREPRRKPRWKSRCQQADCCPLAASRHPDPGGAAITGLITDERRYLCHHTQLLQVARMWTSNRYLVDRDPLECGDQHWGLAGVIRVWLQAAHAECGDDAVTWGNGEGKASGSRPASQITRTVEQRVVDRRRHCHTVVKCVQLWVRRRGGEWLRILIPMPWPGRQ
jgi:hypothetical protein